MTKLKEVVEEIEYAKEKIGLFACLSIFIIVSFFVFGFYGLRYVGNRIVLRIDNLSSIVDSSNRESISQYKEESAKLNNIDLRLSKLEIRMDAASNDINSMKFGIKKFQ